MIRYGVLGLVIVAIICQYLSIRALQLEQANVISLVENSGSIIVSLLLQIIIFKVSHQIYTPTTKLNYSESGPAQPDQGSWLPADPPLHTDDRWPEDPEGETD